LKVSQSYSRRTCIWASSIPHCRRTFSSSSFRLLHSSSSLALLYSHSNVPLFFIRMYSVSPFRYTFNIDYILCQNGVQLTFRCRPGWRAHPTLGTEKERHPLRRLSLGLHIFILKHLTSL